MTRFRTTLPDWREPLPAGRDGALTQLLKRAPLNCAALASLADAAAPLKGRQPGIEPARRKAPFELRLDLLRRMK